jgi:hypothetical protein
MRCDTLASLFRALTVDVESVEMPYMQWATFATTEQNGNRAVTGSRQTAGRLQGLSYVDNLRLCAGRAESSALEPWLSRAEAGW